MIPAASKAYGALSPPSPRGVRAAAGKALRAGVLVSTATLVAGYVLALVRDRSVFASHATEAARLAGRASFPHSLGALFGGIGQGSGEAIILAGVLMLILTPVAGLLTSAVAFARRGDRLFTAISFGVLSIIVGSFVVGWLVA
ncbi:MAG: DUF1634 domain-containing protein [Acidimicrobiales bacterium]